MAFAAQAATWNSKGSMARAVYAHTATSLQDGRVLAAGGHDTRSATSTAQLYDPISQSWSATAPLAVPRRYHSAALLNDGTVLVAGGLTFSNVTVGGGSCSHGSDFVNLDSVELYNPVAAAWTPSGRLSRPRDSHTATLLDDGTVLVAGGITTFPFDGLDSAEVYNPTARVWVPTGSMSQTRANHTATRLKDGKVLVAGGEEGFNGNPLDSAELYDPVAKTWSSTGRLTAKRKGHTATLLPDGKVLVVGDTTAELYDPSTKEWTATDELASARVHHTATLVGGRVLVVGGSSDEAKTELYDPATGKWSQPDSIATPRSEHTTNLLPGGQVLVAGGRSDSSSVCAFDSTEVRAAADVSVTASASPDPVGIDQEITYTISVRNAGPDLAEGVTVRDSLPPGVVLTSASPGCIEQAAREVTCSLGSLAAGAPAVERRLTVRTTSEAGSGLSNTVTAEGQTPDLNPENNTATAMTRIDRSLAAPAALPATSPAKTGGVTLGAGPSPGSAARLPSSAAQSARPLRSCLRSAARHTRRERGLARRGSARRRAKAKRHLRRHAKRLHARCLRRHGRTPGRVSRLRARAVSATEIALSFGAPGSDRGRPPPARSYLVKQSSGPIRSARDFRRAAALCGGACRFRVTELGEQITLTITGLRPRTSYYYAIAARDNVSGRLGPRSRAVRVRTR